MIDEENSQLEVYLRKALRSVGAGDTRAVNGNGEIETQVSRFLGVVHLFEIHDAFEGRTLRQFVISYSNFIDKFDDANVLVNLVKRILLKLNREFAVDLTFSTILFNGRRTEGVFSCENPRLWAKLYLL